MNRSPKEYASDIIKKELGKNLKHKKVVGTGTITKNYSFIIEEFGKPKYFLKLHGKEKPLREKKASEFYNLNNIVYTPKIISIGDDYTLTLFEENLRETTFSEHIQNLANFHKKLFYLDHKEISKNKLFKMISRKDLFGFVNSNDNLLEGAIPPREFYSIISKLPFSEDLGMKNILIHGDPHRQNLLVKNKKSFFLDLEHTRYSLPTVDLAKLCYNYSPSQIQNILAIYMKSFDNLPGNISKRDFVAGTLSDILLDGASSVITCQVKNLNPDLTKNWVKNFRNYFGYLSNLV